jgi:hypothetical protein
MSLDNVVYAWKQVRSWKEFSRDENPHCPKF